MTDQQLIIFGGMVLTALLGLVAFFLRRLLSDHDQTKRRIDHLDMRFGELKVSIEQNFVDQGRFETMRTEFRGNFESIFKEQAENGKILARLEERSRWEERFGQLLEVLGTARHKK